MSSECVRANAAAGGPDFVAGRAFPLSEMYCGLLEVRDHNRDGHSTFLLGETSTAGWWYFFPVVFFFKTPVAFPLLCLAAVVLLKRHQHVSALCAAVILVVVMPSNINLGIRHILPVYPLLSVCAGAVLWKLLSDSRRMPRVAGAALLAWQLVASSLAHPDYFAYFNELAGSAPEEIRVDSDLDWGQNVERLGRYAREHRIESAIGLGLFGSVDPSRHGLKWYPASPWYASPGWVAVSATEKMLSQRATEVPGRRPWAWLDGHDPVDRIGGSILLYHIPAGAARPQN